MELLASYQFWLYYYATTIFALWFIQNKLVFSAVSAKMKIAFVLALPAFLLVGGIRKGLKKYISYLLK